MPLPRICVMHHLTSLVPARFLSLIAHLIVSITLLWENQQSTNSCLMLEQAEVTFGYYRNQLIVGLSLAVGMIGLEFLSFLSGLTMFHPTSALLSIFSHAGGSVALTCFVLDKWQCGWFWWIFALSSLLPAVYDLFISCKLIVHRKCYYLVVVDIGVRYDYPERVDPQKRPGWSFWLIVAGITSTLGATLPVGYNIGVLNAPENIIKRFCNESLNSRFGAVLSSAELDVLWSAVVSIFLVGGVIGSLTASWLADKIGRKGGYFVSALLNFAGAILFFTARPSNSVEMLVAGRLLVGLAAGLITCIVPMYLIELSPLKVRGPMGVFCSVGLTVGVLLAQIISLQEILGTEEQWPTLLALYGILVIICVIVLPFMPESPKYLYVVKNEPQKALTELSKVRSLPAMHLSGEIEDLQVSKQNADDSKMAWNLLSVIRSKELLLPILLVCSMQAGQQLSGINSVFYYSVSIFQSTGLSLQQSQYANIGCGGMNLVICIVAIPLMSRCNRRTLILMSCFTAAFWLIILGLSIHFISSASWMPYVSIFSVLAYIFFYQLGLGPIPYFIGSELIEVGPRPSVMALGSMANWGANFIVGMSFPSLQRAIGPSSYGIFALITLCLLFFLRRYLPETRGKESSEVALLCKNGLRSRPFASPTSSSVTSETIPSSDIKA